MEWVFSRPSAGDEGCSALVFKEIWSPGREKWEKGSREEGKPSATSAIASFLPGQQGAVAAEEVTLAFFSDPENKWQYVKQERGRNCVRFLCFFRGFLLSGQSVGSSSQFQFWTLRADVPVNSYDNNSNERFETLLWARHGPEHNFYALFYSILPQSRMKWVLLFICLFLKWGNWGLRH